MADFGFGLREQAEIYPMMLVLSFAYPCNALCPHCPYTNSNIRKEYKDMPYMSEEVFKKIADESNDAKLKGLAFELKRTHDEAINIFEEINYDMNKLDRYYIDTQNSLSANYKKVENILNNFKNRIA